MAGRADRVDGDLDAALGAVLEAHRHREPRRQLPVDLALGGAGADRAPGDEVGDELRGDRIEEFAGGRQPEIGQIQQQAPGDAKTFVDGERAVQPWIVDQALPAHGGAGLLEIDPHHDPQIGLQLGRLRPKPPGVVERGDRIMHRAGADDDEEAIVLAGEDADDLLAGAGDDLGAGFAQRELLQQNRRGQEGAVALDVQVAGLHRSADCTRWTGPPPCPARRKMRPCRG